MISFDLDSIIIYLARPIANETNNIKNVNRSKKRIRTVHGLNLFFLGIPLKLKLV